MRNNRVDWMVIFELIVVVSAAGTGVLAGRVILERALEDQMIGATGFVYRTDTNGPTSYVQYSTGHNFGYPPITLGNRELQQLQTVPLASIHPAVGAYGTAVQDHQFYQNPQDGGGGEVSQGSQFSKGESNSGHQATSGDKGEKGHKSLQDYSKGTKGNHNDEEHNAHYNKAGGKKQSNHDSAEQYNKHESSGDSQKGGNFSDASSHKKGSKTTGYHKVYHKDEYKKDHTFYDESASSGHSDKYGGNHAEHSKEDGGYKKGGQSDTGFSKGEQARSGYYDGGKYNNASSGHEASEGADKYYANTTDYSNNGEESNAKKFDYLGGDSETY